jgi:hypothetical protein
MIREAAAALGGSTTNVSVRDWILEHYPGTNMSTIQAQTIVRTVNHASRIHYPENQKPRRADSQYDFLFRRERGQLELYDPARHGVWEIVEGADGRLLVAQAEEVLDTADEEAGEAFAAEAHLRDYLVKHLDVIEPGLELVVDDETTVGVEYPTDLGRIDILAVDTRLPPAGHGPWARRRGVVRRPHPPATQLLWRAGDGDRLGVLGPTAAPPGRSGLAGPTRALAGQRTAGRCRRGASTAEPLAALPRHRPHNGPPFRSASSIGSVPSLAGQAFPSRLRRQAQASVEEVNQ